MVLTSREMPLSLLQSRAAEWSLYELGLYRLVAKCYKENEASRKMLSACMRASGEDETFYYFEKKL